MKRYVILGTLAALSLLLLLVWLRNGRHASKPENSESPQQTVAVGDSSVQSDRGATETEPRPMVAAPVAAATNEDDEFLRLVRRSTEAANLPVAFYGLVLDQDSNVLQNVSVDLMVVEERVDSFPQHNQKWTPLQRQTDAGGEVRCDRERPQG